MPDVINFHRSNLRCVFFEVMIRHAAEFMTTLSEHEEFETLVASGAKLSKRILKIALKDIDFTPHIVGASFLGFVFLGTLLTIMVNF